MIAVALVEAAQPISIPSTRQGLVKALNPAQMGSNSSCCQLVCSILARLGPDDKEGCNGPRSKQKSVSHFAAFNGT